MLTFFWDMKGPILTTIQAHGETMNSSTYRALPQDQVKSPIHHKQQRLLSKWVLLNYDNGRPHTATATVERLCNGLNLNCFRIPLNTYAWHHPIITYSVPWRRCYTAASLARMVRPSKQYTCSFMNNRKASIRKGWRSLLNDTRSALPYRSTMSKSDICIRVSSVEIKLNEKWCYFLIYPRILNIVYFGSNPSFKHALLNKTNMECLLSFC